MKTKSWLIVGVVVTCAFEILRADCVTPTPDHWWPAEGNASNSVSTAHGTIVNGVIFAAGRFGQAFRFSGTNSEVSFGTTAGNFGTNDFTIAYWVKTTNLAAMYLISKRPSCDHSSFWDISMNAGGSAIEIDQDAAGNGYSGAGTSVTVADDQWHHIAFVRRGSGLSCYRDGTLMNSNTASSVAQIINSAPLRAGASPCAGINGTVRFSGLLDEIKLYSCALTPSQIADAAGIPDPNRPMLNIAPLPGGVRLTWTTNAINYLLETNAALTLSAGWGVLTSNYSIIETNYAVTNFIGSAMRFYRLHKP